MPRAAAAQSRRGCLDGLAAALLRRCWIVRTPILLYQARLGFLLGPRLLVVASGFGSRAQWFRNVRADPKIRVSTGFRRPTPATARPLTSEDAQTA